MNILFECRTASSLKSPKRPCRRVTHIIRGSLNFSRLLRSLNVFLQTSQYQRAEEAAKIQASCLPDGKLLNTLIRA